MVFILPPPRGALSHDHKPPHGSLRTFSPETCGSPTFINVGYFNVLPICILSLRMWNPIAFVVTDSKSILGSFGAERRFCFSSKTSGKSGSRDTYQVVLAGFRGQLENSLETSFRTILLLLTGSFKLNVGCGAFESNLLLAAGPLFETQNMVQPVNGGLLSSMFMKRSGTCLPAGKHRYPPRRRDVVFVSETPVIQNPSQWDCAQPWNCTLQEVSAVTRCETTAWAVHVNQH